MSIGESIDALAAEQGITREAQDRWTERSHREASRAAGEGKLAEEIVPVGRVAADDALCRAPALPDFGAAKASFSDAGTVTRLNSHAIVDGASALVLASEDGLRASGRPPLGRLCGAAYAGVPPRRMGLASVPAVQRLLSESGLRAEQVDLFELNETFAAQVLLDLRELGLPEEKVNVNGGALALGHPFAATGCRQVLSLLLELRRRKARRGIASICVGGGQGIAVLVETV